MKFVLTIFLCYLALSSSEAKKSVRDFLKDPLFKDFYGKIDGDIKVGDAGEPLILTDLVRQGRIDEAKSASRVDPPLLGVESYTGYFTVDGRFNSNIFFWFFPSQSNYQQDPLILWLQGGPGATSMFGLFEENGPFVFLADGSVGRREVSWSDSNSLLYIDNPVGTGWSFTNEGYAQNQTKVGEDLYEALVQFFTLFPELQSKDFYITGESYAGKYVPAISHTILQRNPTASLQIPLKGIAIGNGLTDPVYQFRYSDYVYQHGIVDFNTKNSMVEYEDQAINYINQGRYPEANDAVQSVYSILGFKANLDIYNYLTLVEDGSADAHMSDYFAREDVRRSLHVGNTPFNDDLVYENLQADIAQSQASVVAELLSHYKVLIYNGQLDIICAYPMTYDYLRNLKFDSADEYARADRRIWYENEVVAGYVKTAGNLTEVLVRNAGHMVPNDQPHWTMSLINKFVRNQPIV